MYRQILKSMQLNMSCFFVVQTLHRLNHFPADNKKNQQGTAAARSMKVIPIPTPHIRIHVIYCHILYTYIWLVNKSAYKITIKRDTWIHSHSAGTMTPKSSGAHPCNYMPFDRNYRQGEDSEKMSSSRWKSGIFC